MKQRPNLSVKLLASKKIESGESYAYFIIGNLQSGQALTLGNHLRRALLKDLGGYAISSVRFNGINHEFATIPGVREDILEILLNLKAVVIEGNNKNLTDEVGRLKICGPKVILADSIELPTDLKVVNSNQYIATISNENSLEIEFKIEYGKGYQLVSRINEEEKDTNFIEVDRIFMCVQKVNFKIDTIFDDDNNITEQLLLEVWTDGSITPTKAVIEAAKSIINLFQKLLEAKDYQQQNQENLQPRSVEIEPYRNVPIEDVPLSVRSYNCLKKAQINTIGDILNYPPENLPQLKNFGKKSADEVFSLLNETFGIQVKIKKKKSKRGRKNGKQ